MFRELDKYKHVVSPGLYMNNVESSSKFIKGITYTELNEYIHLSKFTIAGESFSFPGIVTEKIVRPFMFHSIPIYYGNPRIEEDFNRDAFIKCNSRDDIEKMVDKVQYLDTHDDAYLEMLMQSPFYDNEWCVRRYEALEKWLVDIASQDKDNAYRRAMDGMAVTYQKALKRIAGNKDKSLCQRMLEIAYNIKKNIHKKLSGQKVH